MLRGASTDRDSFEANQSLTHQEAANSINHKKEGLYDLANNEKRGLTTGGLVAEAGGAHWGVACVLHGGHSLLPYLGAEQRVSPDI